jgi:hypothetical protein
MFGAQRLRLEEEDTVKNNKPPAYYPLSTYCFCLKALSFVAQTTDNLVHMTNPYPQALVQ